MRMNNTCAINLNSNFPHINSKILEATIPTEAT